jgi:hypothetical protein
VTIFRGGIPPTIVPGSIAPGTAEIGSVTIYAGTRSVVVMPQQMTELPGAPLPIGAGAGMGAGTITLPTLGNTIGR